MKEFRKLFIPETDCNFIEKEISQELQDSCCDEAHCDNEDIDCGECIFRTHNYNDFFDFIKSTQNGRENKESN